MRVVTMAFVSCVRGGTPDCGIRPDWLELSRKMAQGRRRLEGVTLRKRAAMRNQSPSRALCIYAPQSDPERPRSLSMKAISAAVLFGAALFAAPAAWADGARDDLIRTEAQIAALNTADASAASAVNYKEAQLRLSEARIAEEKNREEESMWRSAEASLQADIVQKR
jgi:hypothetical protein